MTDKKIGDPKRCRAKTKKGRRCRITNNLSEKNGFCLIHDPDRADKVREMRRKGGSVTAKRFHVPADMPEPLADLDDAVTWSSWIAWNVTAGKLNAKRASEANRAVQTFLKAYNAAAKIKELERQLKDAVKRLKRAEKR